jgi:phenylpyruvate tautomerase PptA (4-oxalocrotonate tautomerase family)
VSARDPADANEPGAGAYTEKKKHGLAARITDVIVGFAACGGAD